MRRPFLCHLHGYAGAEAAADDFAFFSAAGQIEGDPATLKVEDFWDTSAIDRAVELCAQTLEYGRIDCSTALYNLAGFVAHGNEMLADCSRDARPLSVAVFDCADLLEVRAIYGNRMARRLADRIVCKLSALSVDCGLAARTGPAEFSVVLPGMGREKALAAISRVLGNPLSIEMEAGDSEIVLVPGFLVETAGINTWSVEELHGELRCELARQQECEQRRQHHMQRERHHHSRPMGIVARAKAT